MDLGRLDLNLLVALHSLLTERNISRAALRTGLSQPAMSRALQRLRVNFDDELLVRVGRDYSLTPFAQELVNPLHEILVRLEHTARRRPRFNPETDEHVFRIAISDANEYLLLKPLMDRLIGTAPGVVLDVLAFAGARSWRMVEEGELDLCISSLDHYNGNLNQQVLYWDRLVYAVWSRREDIGTTITEEQLATLPHVAYNWPGHADRGRSFPERRAVDQFPVQIADEHHITRLLLLRGTGLVTMTFEKLAENLAEVADVRVVQPPGEARALRHGLIWHPRDTTAPAHRWLRQQLIEIGREL
jgi:LysR family transcriptional regulator, nod-box dependent transcriptional activator